MGDLTVSERAAYRGRDRLRREVVAELTPDNSGDASYTLTAADVGLDSIESVAFETPTINSGATDVSWDQANNNIDAWDRGTVAANTTDLSAETIVAVVTGPVE